jgi:Acetyltransferase (GNAT) family
MLFVHPDSWRRGIGRSLHDLAVAEMSAHGYRRARLWTPTEAGGARAFYRRAGWIERGSVHHDPIGLDLTICELDLRGSRRSRLRSLRSRWRLPPEPLSASASAAAPVPGGSDGFGSGFTGGFGGGGVLGGEYGAGCGAGGQGFGGVGGGGAFGHGPGCNH